MQVSAQILPTVAIYDEPEQTNAVDFVATGSTLDFDQFKSDVALAYTNDFGGVNQCKVIGGNAGPYTFSYGAGGIKRLNMTGHTNNAIGILQTSEAVQSISESLLWGSTKATMIFYLGNITSYVPNEKVIKFGLTVSSTSLYTVGNVVAQATFSGGGKSNASRFISEAGGSGDTFFGFAAPGGQSIVSIAFTNLSGHFIYFDDIGFITAQFPPLTISKFNESQALISWPTSSIGFSLEFSTNLSAAMWISDTNIPTIVGDQFAVTADSGAGHVFYRLRRP